MGRDTPLSIHIEVTVPQIVIPTLTRGKEQTSSVTIKEEAEQVHLLPIHTLAPPQKTSSLPEDRVVVEDASTYTTRSGLFNLFHFTAILVQKQPYLLQVLRRWKGKQQDQSSGMKDAKFNVTNELAFLLEYRSTADDIFPSEGQGDLAPGLRHVVIVLDEEGMPVNYTIDGAGE